jgi:hypothetical protein
MIFLQLEIFSQIGAELYNPEGTQHRMQSSKAGSSIGRTGRHQIHTNDQNERTAHVHGRSDTFIDLHSVRTKAKNVSRSDGEVEKSIEAMNLGLNNEASYEWSSVDKKKELVLIEPGSHENEERKSDNEEEEQENDKAAKSVDTEGSGDKSSEEKEQGSEEEEDMYFRDPDAPVADWKYFPQSRREPRRDASWNDASPPLNENECERFMENIDTSPPLLREPSGEACEGYDGVLHINHFDPGGASGASFFLFNIGMLAWADQHNYLPWIFIDDNYTRPIWDPIVHTNVTENITYVMMTGMDIGWARDPKDSEWHIFPGKPYRKEPAHSKRFVLTGTGVWEHYFLPPNDFVAGDASCRNKPVVYMNEDHIVPGIHSNAPWAPRAWRYSESTRILRKELSWDSWFKPQRKRAAEITERYIRFNPMMERRANCAFPNPEFSLGMHIRHGDKTERHIIEPDRFLVFAEAFVNNGGGSIYLATDSSSVVETILKDWPKHVVDHIVYQASVKGRSSNDTAAFDLGISAHRTNVEALTDVLALSKCTFFLHGLSAMSEAALYLNPGLVARSINLEDKLYKKFRPEFFVNSIMPLGKKEAKS